MPSSPPLPLSRQYCNRKYQRRSSQITSLQTLCLIILLPSAALLFYLSHLQPQYQHQAGYLENYDYSNNNDDGALFISSEFDLDELIKHYSDKTGETTTKPARRTTKRLSQISSTKEGIAVNYGGPDLTNRKVDFRETKLGPKSTWLGVEQQAGLEKVPDDGMGYDCNGVPCSRYDFFHEDGLERSF